MGDCERWGKVTDPRELPLTPTPLPQGERGFCVTHLFNGQVVIEGQGEGRLFVQPAATPPTRCCTIVMRSSVVEKAMPIGVMVILLAL